MPDSYRNPLADYASGAKVAQVGDVIDIYGVPHKYIGNDQWVPVKPEPPKDEQQ